MPWQLEQRGKEWCVVKVGESDPVPGGCHASRADAIKHQRALYANESRTASMYEELDACTEEYVPPSEPTLAEKAQELKIVVSQENALTAAVVDLVAASEQRSDSLLEALRALADKPPPTVTVEAPQITIEPAPLPEVRVEAPQVTVQSPPPAQVTVQNDIVLPPSEKTVTFERDPRTGQLTGATVEESNDIPS